MNFSRLITKSNIQIFIGFCVAVAIFSMGLRVNDTKAQSSSSVSMPTSGSCALLVTLPVPYLSTANLGATGYNLLGQLSFTSATAGTFNGSIVNPTFQTGNSPYISSGSTLFLNNWTVAVSALTSNNGFVGGYKLTFSGTISNTATSFDFYAVPANSGKTILLQSSSVGTAQSPGIGPGSGICQI
jgi:hypothetical protein